MSRKLFLVLLVFACTFYLDAQVTLVKIPRVEKRWINVKILTEQKSTPWSFAAVLHGFVKLDNPGKDAESDTQARLFHDGEKLYFGFFRTVETASLCNAEGRDGAAYADDSIGLLIAPDAAHPDSFYQIAISANGAVYDEERFPDNTFNVGKDFNSLKLNVFKGERAWLLYASIDLAEIGILAGRQFAISLTCHLKETSGKEEYSTWAPMKRMSFLCWESFVPAVLDGPQSTPEVYTFSDKPELCLDGEGEFGSNERWIRRNGAWISPYLKGSGTHCINVTCEPGAEIGNWFHTLALEPSTRYLLKFTCYYGTCETPNLIPVRIHCFDVQGTELAVLDGPGLGNLGGGVSNYKFAPYKKDFVTPEGTASAELEARVVNTGSVNLDSISVRKYTPVTHIPTLVYPENNAILRTDQVEFKWSLFARPDLRPGTLTIECSQDRSFPKDKTLVFGECALDPMAREGWMEKLPMQGQWFWRARFDGEDGGVWSNPNAFVIDYNAENEKISPEIHGMTPRGRMATRPEKVQIAYDDPGISSGIDKVRLFINRKDVTSTADVASDEITFHLPDDNESFYEIQLFVTDRNGNKAEENDFIAVAPGKGVVRLDEKGFITIDGRRFFPVSGYAHMDSKNFPFMREFGFNCNMSPWMTPPNPELWKLIADATRAGIVTIPITIPEYLWGKGFVKSNTRAAKRFLEKETRYAAKMQGHPGIIGFYTGDESIDAGYSMAAYQEFYEALKKAAPDLPKIWLPTYGQTNSYAWKGAVKACDMFFHDDYVSQRNQHLNMFKDIARISQWTGAFPFIEILGAHAPTIDWNKPVKRFPTYEDMRYCSWASIVAGSRGMAVYREGKYKSLSVNPYEKTNAPDFNQRLGKVLQEINQAVPWLISDKLPERAAKVLTGDVRLLERVYDGKILTIAVNAGETTAEVELGNGQRITLQRLGVSLNYY
ncbi:MAG: hypothetical protein J6X55_05430 [Victivallales bacterium]|nr:hypothetical protein [Victivallales bacterium]